MRFRKGELQLYKSMNPSELEKYVNDYPENTDYVKKFIFEYRYDFVKKKWIKNKRRELYE